MGATSGYIFGFSAGAAFTPNLIVNYADRFDAAGIHSGVEYDAAETATGGTYVMSNGGPDPYDQAWAAYQKMQDYGITSRVPTCVFQGTDDSTVEPPNGEQSAIQAATTCYYANGGGVDYSLSQADTSSGWEGGKSYTRHQFKDNYGRTNVDFWKVDGLGHDWSGGASSGYYTDPNAPGATQHMFEFFSNW